MNQAEQRWLKRIGRVALSNEDEWLKTLDGEGVFRIVEENLKMCVDPAV
jgi:hypothetical protein